MCCCSCGSSSVYIFPAMHLAANPGNPSRGCPAVHGLYELLEKVMSASFQGRWCVCVCVQLPGQNTPIHGECWSTIHRDLRIGDGSIAEFYSLSGGYAAFVLEDFNLWGSPTTELNTGKSVD